MREYRIFSHLFLGLCARLSVVAVPVDPSNVDQASIGFDPLSYVYFKGDTFPPDGPGPGPQAPLDQLYTPTSSPLTEEKKPSTGGEEADYDRQNPIQTTRKPEDFPVWLDRSRPIPALTEWPPRELRLQFADGIKTFCGNISSSEKPATRGVDIKKEAWILRLGWLNPRDQSFPPDLRIGDHTLTPGELLVRREKTSQEPGPEDVPLVDWAPRRLLAANPLTTNGLGGYTVLSDSESRFAFGYRLYHVAEIQRLASQGQTPNPFPSKNGDLEKLFREAGATPFGSPWLRDTPPPDIPYPPPNSDPGNTDDSSDVQEHGKGAFRGDLQTALLAMAVGTMYVILMCFLGPLAGVLL
ncbi:MAG: hypothetical protein M1831_002644 [Alyxoria varia]|nr:MAG: hypothetical protein M1831_002644 [Alyxoria varia]